MGVDALLEQLNQYERSGPVTAGDATGIWADIITKTALYDADTTAQIGNDEGRRFATTGGQLVVFDGWDSGCWHLDDDSVDARLVRLAALNRRIRKLAAQRATAAAERDQLIAELWPTGAERKKMARIAGITRPHLYEIAERATAATTA